MGFALQLIISSHKGVSCRQSFSFSLKNTSTRFICFIPFHLTSWTTSHEIFLACERLNWHTVQSVNETLLMIFYPLAFFCFINQRTCREVRENIWINSWGFSNVFPLINLFLSWINKVFAIKFFNPRHSPD